MQRPTGKTEPGGRAPLPGNGAATAARPSGAGAALLQGMRHVLFRLKKRTLFPGRPFSSRAARLCGGPEHRLRGGRCSRRFLFYLQMQKNVK